MSWIDEQNETVKANALTLVAQLKLKGITNIFAQAAVLAIGSKESSLIPKQEKGYSKTTNDRIRKIFGTRVEEFTEVQLTALKANDEDFFNHIYNIKFKVGKDLGNVSIGSGYNYRGGGINQLTGEASFKKYGTLAGHNIHANPELLNDMAVASDVLIAFFIKRFAGNDCNCRLEPYNSTGLNDFSNITDAVGAYYHANTGWGKTKAQIDADTTGGHQRAIERGPEFVVFIEQNAG